jgi:hypothetical protein
MSLVGYQDSSEEEQSVPANYEPKVISRAIQIAPEVYDNAPKEYYTKHLSREVDYNPKYEALWTPVAGAHHPLRDDPMMVGGTKNVLTGFVENAHMNNFDFEEQYYAYQTYGNAHNPTIWGGNGMLRGGSQQTIWQTGKNSKHAPLKRKKAKEGSYLGPWAGFEGYESGEEAKAKNKKEREEALAATAEGKEETKAEEDQEAGSEVEEKKRKGESESVPAGKKKKVEEEEHKEELVGDALEEKDEAPVQLDDADLRNYASDDHWETTGASRPNPQSSLETRSTTTKAAHTSTRHPTRNTSTMPASCQRSRYTHTKATPRASIPASSSPITATLWSRVRWTRPCEFGACMASESACVLSRDTLAVSKIFLSPTMVAIS